MKREDRTRLEAVIPISTPYVVHIETSNVCNFKCKFCVSQNENVKKNYGIKTGFMPYDKFVGIIDDMKKFPEQVKSLHLYLGGEPLMHKDMPRMVKYAKDSDVAKEVILFSNATLLSRQLSDELIDAGLDKIQFSIEGTSSEKYKDITGVDVDYDRLVNNIEYFYQHKGHCKVFAKILDTDLSQMEIDKFYKDFKEISDDCFVECLIDFASHDDVDTSMGHGSTYTQEWKKLESKMVCTPPFYVMLIYWNGNVSPCSCGDYRRKLNMGNVFDESVTDIWNCERWNEFRKIQLKKSRDQIEICKDCKAIYNQLDNIDSYADELLKKFN